MKKPMELTAEQRNHVINELTKPGAPFEVSFKEIRGEMYPVFSKAFRNLKEMYGSCFDLGHPVIRELLRWYGKDDEFIVYKNERLTFRQVYQTAAALSHRLKTQFGIRKGDRVALAIRNYPEFCYIFMAATAIGAVAVPLNAWWNTSELIHAISDCAPSVLFVDQERLDRLADRRGDLNAPVVVVRPNNAEVNCEMEFYQVLGEVLETEFPNVTVSPDDDCYIMYTSGSTGKPKGVVATHRAVIGSIMSWHLNGLGAIYLYPDLLKDIRPKFRPSILLCVPMFHVTGLIAVFLASFFIRRKVVMMHKWDPEKALELIENERITIFNGVPTMSWELVNASSFFKADTQSLEMLGGGGAERPPDHVRAIHEIVSRPIIQAGYGLTESSSLGTTIRGREYLEKPDSVGRVTPPLIEIQIRDESGAVLPANRVGEIHVKSCTNLKGYWNDIQATREVLLEGGWLKTGDIGCLDENGFLYIRDRLKDIVIRGGENISCKEVEFAIYEHPSVFEAVVFGVPDERLGEQIGAAIMPKPGKQFSRAALQEFLDTRLAAFKIPQHVWVYQDPFPRLGNGKIFKRKVKEDALKSLNSEPKL